MALDIKPLKEGHAVTYRQPKNDVIPRIPFRGLCLAPSSSGKTLAIVNMLTRPEFYGGPNGLFTHIYWASPTATIDPALDALREYVKTLDQDQDEDPTFHDSVDVEFLQSRVNRQRKVVEHMKKSKTRQHGFACAIIIDDLADVKRGLPQVARFVDSLFVKCRHWGVSVILSSQKLKLPLISPTVRVNLTFALIFRLRNNTDLIDGFENEYSAIVDKDTLHAMYMASVAKPFGFLYLNLVEQDRNRIFYNGFHSRFLIDGNGTERPHDDMSTPKSGA